MLVVFGPNDNALDLENMPRSRRPKAGDLFTRICGTHRTDWESFVHSPFKYITEGNGEDFNDSSLVLQAVLREDDAAAALLIGGDAGCQIWKTVYNKSKEHGNLDRLAWDIFVTPHHGSYKFFSEKEHEEGRREAQRQPVESSVKLLDLGNNQAWLVCPSRPIKEGNYEDKDPPHSEAITHYRHKAKALGDPAHFVCLMEHPTKDKPTPLVLRVTGRGLQELAEAAPSVTTGAQVVDSVKHWGQVNQP